MPDERDTKITTIGELKAVLAAHEKVWVENGLEDFDDLPLIFGVDIGTEAAVFLRNAVLCEAGDDGDVFGIFGDWPAREVETDTA